MIMAKKSIESEIKAAQEKMKSKLKQEKTKKKTTKTTKEKYKEVREKLNEKNIPKEHVFKDNYEEELIKELFNGSTTVNEILGKESEPVKITRSGEWDYTIDDPIEFFDPECSYELTGYKPITETKGLDFNPEWFTEAARTYEETGYYTEYPQGSKPYNDYWLEQLDRCTSGYTVNGYRITPDHYFFLNFYRMNIVDDSKKAATGSKEGFPKFLAEQYKFFHYFELCEHLKKDVVALKSRGIN